MQAALWEMWALVNKKAGDSFSAVIHKLAKEQPFIAFMFGMLAKHLFGGDPETRQAYEAGYAAGDNWPLKDKEDAQ